MNWPVKNVTVCISNVLYCIVSQLIIIFYGRTLCSPNPLRLYFINLIMRIHLAGILVTFGNIYLSTGVFELICYTWLPQQPYLWNWVSTKFLNSFFELFSHSVKKIRTFLGKLKSYKIFKAIKNILMSNLSYCRHAYLIDLSIYLTKYFIGTCHHCICTTHFDSGCGKKIFWILFCIHFFSHLNKN